MQKHITENTALEKDSNQVEKKPNEQLGYYFSSSLKITDPKSGEVLVQMRCD